MSADGCDGCSRRALLRGIALTAAGAALAACRGSDPSGADAGLDGPPVDAGEPIGTMCGANMCIDLTNPAASALTSPDGSVLVEVPGDRIIVLSQADGTFIALSDICTHAGCAVSFNQALTQLTCPCHGSRFTLTGSVARGPAARPLKSYTTMVDTQTQVLTIVL